MRNIFAYVGGNPLGLIDLEGLAGKIPKSYGQGKPMNPVPNPVEDATKAQESTQNAVDTLKCLIWPCEAERNIKDARRCDQYVCQSKGGGQPFKVDLNNAECRASDPDNTVCVCTHWGFDPNYKGGSPPGLTPP
jgi:hypothetical protein